MIAQTARHAHSLRGRFPWVRKSSSLVNDVRIIQNGLLLKHASFAESLAALRSDLIDASASSANGSLSDGLPADDLSPLADPVMKHSIFLGEGG